MNGVEKIQEVARENGWDIVQRPALVDGYPHFLFYKGQFFIDMQMYLNGTRVKNARVTVDGKLIENASNLQQVTWFLTMLDNWPGENELDNWPFRIDTVSVYGDTGLYCGAYVMHETSSGGGSWPQQCTIRMYGANIKEIREDLARHIATWKHVSEQDMLERIAFGGGKRKI